MALKITTLIPFNSREMWNFALSPRSLSDLECTLYVYKAQHFTTVCLSVQKEEGKKRGRERLGQKILVRLLPLLHHFHRFATVGVKVFFFREGNTRFFLSVLVFFLFLLYIHHFSDFIDLGGKVRVARLGIQNCSKVIRPPHLYSAVFVYILHFTATFYMLLSNLPMVQNPLNSVHNNLECKYLKSFRRLSWAELQDVSKVDWRLGAADTGWHSGAMVFLLILSYYAQYPPIYYFPNSVQNCTE